jgi:hypothetical protein
MNLSEQTKTRAKMEFFNEFRVSWSISIEKDVIFTRCALMH